MQLLIFFSLINLNFVCNQQNLNLFFTETTLDAFLGGEDCVDVSIDVWHGTRCERMSIVWSDGGIGH